MYHMEHRSARIRAMPRRTRQPGDGPTARERLLAGAMDHVAEHGVGDLTLRGLAAALAAMLLDEDATPAEIMRRAWRHIADPSLWPNERLFFEIYTQALQGHPH